jgi:hypothetical protein
VLSICKGCGICGNKMCSFQNVNFELKYMKTGL